MYLPLPCRLATAAAKWKAACRAAAVAFRALVSEGLQCRWRAGGVGLLGLASDSFCLHAVSGARGMVLAVLIVERMRRRA